MAIVTPPPQAQPAGAIQPAASGSIHEDTALLEVVVLHPRDAEVATAGGADRLLVLTAAGSGGRTPGAALVSAVVRETDLPVRVLLRADESYGITADDFRKYVDLAATFRELGAVGFSFGFLDRDLEIDRASCAELARELGAPWSFHRGFDAALYPERAWRDVLALPGIDGVASAGSTRGFAIGGEELIERARADAGVARLLLASGGLTTEEIPWLIRAGVRQFALGDEVRQDRSWDKAYVGLDYVRSWRMLLDDALMRSLGIPVD
jgi:copper homeostasis protein